MRSFCCEGFYDLPVELKWGEVVCVCMHFPSFQGSWILILILIRSNNFTAFCNFTEIRSLIRVMLIGVAEEFL